jgi:hypothetical protein
MRIRSQLPPVPGGHDGERVGVAGAGVEEVVGPFGSSRSTFTRLCVYASMRLCAYAPMHRITLVWVMRATETWRWLFVK